MNLADRLRQIPHVDYIRPGHTPSCDGCAIGLAADRIEELEAAAVLLIHKLKVVHNDERYLGVWQCAQVHQGPYNGPQYEEELEGLKAVLSPTASSGGH